MAGQQSFLRIHRGYRIARILKMMAHRAYVLWPGDSGNVAGFRSAPGCRSAKKCCCKSTSSLRPVGQKLATRLPGSMISHLFAYQSPRCAFTRLEKQVLERAIEHCTDEEIAVALGITSAAVTLRWRSIYARVAERAPFALKPQTGSAAVVRRKEKRRQVIAFVDIHPEEFRP